jgi:integrase
MLLAQGKSLKEVAAELGVADRSVIFWRDKYTALWRNDYGKAIEAVVKAARENAGTDAVFDNPDLHVMLATRAEKWVKIHGGTLFDPPPEGAYTLCSFYERWYVPTILMGAKESTRHQYEFVLKYWRLLTGDPPLDKIDGVILGKFMQALMALRNCGRDGGALSINTVRSKMELIHHILVKAGPPGPRNWAAAGILPRVPYVKPPRAVEKMPQVVELADLSACYLAADKMERPVVANVPAADWWRALLVVAYNTGLRTGSLLSMRLEHIDWEKGIATLPGDVMKAGRCQVLKLNDTAMDHLERVRGLRQQGLVFECPWSREWFMRHFKQLQELAGIPRDRRFGFHAIRRTLATALWELSPQAAKLMLGHTNEAITIRHYVHPVGIIGRAMAVLPQPEGFAAMERGAV